jgi:hypothetical protein
MGFRFDYICKILGYNDEYTQKVWSDYASSATYPKPNRAREAHERVIAPMDKGVGAESEGRAPSPAGSEAEEVPRELASSGGMSHPLTRTWKISNQSAAQTQMSGPVLFPYPQSKLPAHHPPSAPSRANASALRIMMMRKAEEKRIMAVVVVAVSAMKSKENKESAVE